jgi:hypothetical protein
VVPWTCATTNIKPGQSKQRARHIHESKQPKFNNEGQTLRGVVPSPSSQNLARISDSLQTLFTLNEPSNKELTIEVFSTLNNIFAPLIDRSSGGYEPAISTYKINDFFKPTNISIP